VRIIRGNVIIPSQIIYIDIPSGVSRQRAISAGIDGVGLLQRDDFNGGYKGYFEKIGIMCPGLVIFIDGTKGVAELTDEIGSLIVGN